MDYILSLSDSTQQSMVLLTLEPQQVSRAAIDVVFDVIGNTDQQELVRKNIIGAGQVEDLRALQTVIFDRDADGTFIREGVTFTANGADLNPDEPLERR